MEGTAFGDDRAVAGEVVFNTGMSGYVEALSDPSYRGQILVLTYPLAGNYGVPASRVAGSLERPFESDRVQVQGLVVQNYVEDFSHHAAQRSLGAWLREHGVPGITGIDTRMLTRRLRERGTMQGWLLPSTADIAASRAGAASVEMKYEVFRLVAPAAPVDYPGGPPRIMVIDVGAKDNIVRSLLERGAGVLRVPWHEDFAALSGDVDGIVIGNGPGDPRDLGSCIERLRALLQVWRKPLFGICLGHQLLCLAAGAETYKLPYGHRGVNQPVQDLVSRRCYITSQNHGYAVSEGSLPTDWETWFVNVNDGTSEGARARNRPFFSVQFHPEASPGPRDTAYLFDEFLAMVRTMGMS